MHDNNYLVIMAGGVGSRFWPVSTDACPKQFLDILGCGRTLIQLTYDRFKRIVPAENVWGVTSKDYADEVKRQLPDVNPQQVLAEPCRRNTAPCICYVSWRIKKLNPKANIVVTPSDHMVADVRAFEEAVSDSLEFASETDAIVTLGLKPTRPETGYGYIKADMSYSSSRKNNIFRVDTFVEKPDLEHAREFVAQPNFLWNSGIFIWNVSTVVNAFRVYQPAMSNVFESLLPVYGTDKEQEAIDHEFPECESISVDYAILEKAEEIFVYPAEFPWSDLGSWTSLHEQKDKDPYGNVKVGGDVELYDSFNCVVHVAGLRKVVVQGLDGYVVAENDGQLLICKLSEEQRIKLFH